MRKVDIETRSTGQGRYATLKVKAHHFPDWDTIGEWAGIPSARRETVSQWVWEACVQSFWEQAQQDAEQIWGDCAEVEAEGRSGGWLIVKGIGLPEDWDAIAVAKWGKFSRWIEDSLKDHQSKEFIMDLVEANKWAHPQAERYNFYTDKFGRDRCIATMDSPEEAEPQGAD